MLHLKRIFRLPFKKNNAFINLLTVAVSIFTPTKENNVFLLTGLNSPVKGGGLVAEEAELLSSLLNSCSVMAGHGYLEKNKGTCFLRLPWGLTEIMEL